MHLLRREEAARLKPRESGSLTPLKFSPPILLASKASGFDKDLSLQWGCVLVRLCGQPCFSGTPLTSTLKVVYPASISVT